MLTLTRRIREQLIIDVPAGPARQIVVGLKSIQGNKAKLCTVAPPEVRVLRAELHPEFVDNPLLFEFRAAEAEDVEASPIIRIVGAGLPLPTESER